MARIAIAGHPKFSVSEIEATRPGPHYSVETLESVHRHSPDEDLFFLIGADSLAELVTWRQPARIAQLATIVVVNRPGIDEVAPQNLPEFGPTAHRLVTVTMPRSASRRPTCGDGWPQAGASGTWCLEASKLTSRRMGCIALKRTKDK
jgi:nicotinate-nucleotide adenylyltransferase